MYIIKKHTYIYIQNIHTHPINIHTSKHIHIICTHMCSVSDSPATRIYILHIYVSKYTHIIYTYTHKRIYKDACIQCIYVYTHI